ncbi:MAG: hypothetical protein ABI888_06205 [Chloroflexota bacterium]
MSGWLVGIPFTSGPITLFLYLDHGAGFATNAALGSLLGIFATIAWGLAYSSLAWRGTALLPCVLAGLVVFAAVGTVVRDLPIGPLPLYFGLVIVLLVSIRLVPPSSRHDGVHLPWWDLPARMILATSLVLTITGSATLLGPRLAGLLATIPLYASILSGFAHTLAGPRSAVDVWRGLLYGLFGFGAFYLMLAMFLEPFGLAAFAVAIGAAVLMQVATLRMVRRLPATPPGTAS